MVVARVTAEDDEKRWLDVVSLDAGGGGKVLDPLRVDFQSLPRLEDAYDRLRCLRGRQEIEVAWAGGDGPRIYYLPLFADSRADDEQGVLEIHTAGVMAPEEKRIVGQLHRIYRNMYTLLAYSDRDALTGLLNRKSLDDTFYSAVLEELDGVLEEATVDSRRARNAATACRPTTGWAPSSSTTSITSTTSTVICHGRSHAAGGAHHEQHLPHARPALPLRRRAVRRAVSLPRGDLALGVFERLRTNVEKYSFPQSGRITVSAGFARVLTDDSPDAALERTELAIDFAQRNGRNKVCSYVDLVRRGVFGKSRRRGR